MDKEPQLISLDEFLEDSEFEGDMDDEEYTNYVLDDLFYQEELEFEDR